MQLSRCEENSVVFLVLVMHLRILFMKPPFFRRSLYHSLKQLHINCFQSVIRKNTFRIGGLMMVKSLVFSRQENIIV